MRLLRGMPQDINGDSISSYSLINAAINDPDKLPIVYQAFPGEARISSYLGLKGYYTKGLRDNTTQGNYRVVKSNHVQYAVKMDKNRTVRFVLGPTGTTYVAQDMLKIGIGGIGFKIYVDSNYARPNEVIYLGDAAKTQLFVYDEREPEEVDGGFCYNVKLVGNNHSAWVDPSLLQEGDEAGVGMNMYEHDFSETGSERYAFDTYADAYMTVQRVKMSWSGTAAAMGNSATWYEHNGGVTFLTKAEQDMFARIAEMHEFQIVHGKGTVSIDGKVMLKDRRGRDILAGDGILNQGYGAFEYPLNKQVTLGYLENIMRDLDISVDHDGVMEVIAPMGKAFYSSFASLMRKEGFLTQNNNVVGDGAAKGVINSYSYYEIDGVRLIPKAHSSFSKMPSKMLADGTKLTEWEAFFVPTGKTEYGENKIELVQLRPMKVGTVSGIDKGGDGMATSVDGSEKHILIQSGVICRTKVIRGFRSINS